MLFLLFQASSSSEISPYIECLLNAELYHEDTKVCFPPLTQGPCKTGEWVVLAGISGSGVCRSTFVCKTGEIPVLDPAGGALCGCPDGKERFLGSCETLYTQSVCGEGEILLPNNFNIGDPICPSKFSCKRSDKCLAYKTRATQCGPKGSNIREKQVAFLKDMVCNKKSRTICCIEENSKTLFTPEKVIESMITPKPICVKNTCSFGKYPWVGTDGVSKCAFHDASVETCSYELIEEDGFITCNMFDVRTVAPIFGRKCNRRKRWINDRCQRVF